jgi:hypothetical protein
MNATLLLCAWAMAQLWLAAAFALKSWRLQRAREVRADWLPFSFALGVAAAGVATSSAVTWSCSGSGRPAEVAVTTTAVCLLWILAVAPIFVGVL